jgi:hypothetical protein
LLRTKTGKAFDFSEIEHQKCAIITARTMLVRYSIFHIVITHHQIAASVVNPTSTSPQGETGRARAIRLLMAWNMLSSAAEFRSAWTSAHTTNHFAFIRRFAWQ